MQACHQDKMRFNVLDGKSSVVWPSSLLPGLESKCCERKGGLPSVVTHLNAKDAFLPSSFSFFTLISFASSISLTLFSFYCLIISSLSSSLLISLPRSPRLSLHLPSNFYPALPPPLLLPSRSCISSSCAQSLSLMSVWKSKSPPSPSPDTFAYHSIPSTRISSDKQHTENSLLLYHCMWIDEVVLDKTILNSCNEAC